MARDKKKSKGPQDRNSNYQMKNGNPVSKKRDKKPSSASAAQAGSSKSSGQKGLLSGLPKSISSATSSLTKKLKH
jgi:hypothetical protein